MKATITLLALIAGCGGPCALAAQPAAPQPWLAEGEKVETQIRADFNADGASDLAYIARSAENRELRVVLAGPGRKPQALAIDPYPLGDGTLEVKRGVLVLDDLTGGTTAVSSIRRFRHDAKMQAMRLIGLDATLYSRTYAHDGVGVSWNLLTGTFIQRILHLNTKGGDAAYGRIEERRSSRPSPPLRLEKSPDPDQLLE